MDPLMKLPRDVQIVLVGALLYVIFSFLDWQSVSVGPYSYGFNEWHSFPGVIAALLAIALLGWELAQAFGVKVPTGSFAPGLVPVALGGALLLFTVIIFLDWSDYRSFAQFIGLVLSIVIAVFAFRYAKAEGVEMPSMPKNMGSMGGGMSGGASRGGMNATAAAPPATEEANVADDEPASEGT